MDKLALLRGVDRRIIILLGFVIVLGVTTLFLNRFFKHAPLQTLSTQGSPVIEEVTIEDVDVNSVRIDARFAEMVRAYIEYGPTQDYEFSSDVSGEFGMDHSFLIRNLVPEDIYYYRIVFVNSYGQANVVGGNIFTSHEDKPRPPGQRLDIYLVEIETVSTSTARVSWQTDRAAESIIEYGISEALGSTLLVSGDSPTSHEILLQELQPDTIYFYRPQATTPSGITEYCLTGQFRTLPAPSTPEFPVVSGITIGMVSTSSVLVSWTTSDQVVAGVEYGTTTSYGTYVEADTVGNLSYSLSLSNLSGGTTYYFRVVLVDGKGNTVYSSNQTFETEGIQIENPDIGGKATQQSGGGGLPVAPSDPLLLKVTPLIGAVSFDWLKDSSPINGLINTVIIRKEGTSPVRSRIDGDKVYDGPSTTFVDTGLKNGTEYHYALYSYDSYGRFTSPAGFKVIPTQEGKQVNLSSTAVRISNPPLLSKDLSLEDQGADVSTLQAYLAGQGYYPGLIVDGYFGTSTRVAVIRYQKLNNIYPAEGYVGPFTRESLAN